MISLKKSQNKNYIYSFFFLLFWSAGINASVIIICSDLVNVVQRKISIFLLFQLIAMFHFMALEFPELETQLSYCLQSCLKAHLYFLHISFSITDAKVLSVKLRQIQVSNIIYIQRYFAQSANIHYN